MFGDAVEVVPGDASTLVDLLHPRPGVWRRSSQGGGEELDLAALHSRHVDAGEERRQFLVGQDAGVEVFYDEFEAARPPARAYRVRS